MSRVVTCSRTTPSVPVLSCCRASEYPCESFRWSLAPTWGCVCLGYIFCRGAAKGKLDPTHHPSLLGQIVLPCLINSFLWREHPFYSLWMVMVQCVKHPLFISKTVRHRPEKCPMKTIFLLKQRRGYEGSSLAFILVLLNI